MTVNMSTVDEEAEHVCEAFCVAFKIGQEFLALRAWLLKGIS